MKSNKIMFLVLAVLALTIVGCKPKVVDQPAGGDVTSTMPAGDHDVDEMMVGGDAMPHEKKVGTVAQVDGAQEITMTSFYEIVDDAPKPQYSVNDITVKKGQKVRVKVTNTRGNHDFNIDEFNVHAATPLDQEVVIEFTPTEAGEFIYYCSTPGHRELGHWGILRVTE